MRRPALFVIITTALLTVDARGQTFHGIEIASVTLQKSQVIAGSADSEIAGTVTLSGRAFQDSAVKLSVSPLMIEAGALAFPQPSQVKVLQGATQASFKIKTVANPAYASPTQCTLKAEMAGSVKTATFIVERLSISSLIVLPATVFGPSTAVGTVTLSAIPAPGTTATLTSSNSAVIGFSLSPANATLFFNGHIQQSFGVVAAGVSQSTPVTITVTLNGQRVSQVVTVRPAP